MRRIVELACAVTWAATVVALGSCDGHARPAFVVRDSASVTIVESVSPAWESDDGWKVAESPVFRLGDNDSIWFHGIRDTKMWPDRTIAIAERSSQQIRLFDLNQREMESLGGMGDGPGEFRYLRSLSFLGKDTLIAFDNGIKAVLYSPELALARTVRLPPASNDLYVLGEDLFVRLLSGSVSGSARTGQVLREPGLLVRLTSGDAATDTMAILPGDEEVYLLLDEMTPVSTAPLFGRQEHVAVGPEGLIVGDGVDLGYRVVDRNGLLTRIVRVLDYNLDLTAAEIRRERTARRSPNPELQHLADALPVAERRPAYDRLLVDDLGHVWAREYLGVSRRDASAQWEVFDPLGRWLGPVTTPADLDVRQIGERAVLGVSQDQQGRETVEVWQLRR